MKTKRFGQSGFTLIEVLIAVGLLGVLSVGLMKMFENVNFMQSSADAGVEETELKHEVRMLIDNPEHCSLSFKDAADIPLTFRKSQIDKPADGEGLPISLYMKALPTGRTPKFSTDPTVTARYKKLKFTSILLSMDSENGGKDYPASTKSSDIGQMIFNLKKGSKDIRITFPLIVELDTDAQGVTTPISCRTRSDNNPCPALSMKLDENTGKCRYQKVTPGSTTLHFGSTSGIWGSDGPEEICPENMLACGIQHKGEDNRGTSEDDTALNGVKLLCCHNNFGVLNVKEIASYVGPFGEWRDQEFCPMGSYIRGFNHKWEGNKGNGDDTASNGVSVICSDPAATILNPWEGPFGSWQGGYQSCQKGEYVCGIRTKVEGNQHGNDDTSFNDLSMRCCSVEDEPVGGSYNTSHPNSPPGRGAGGAGGGGTGCFIAGTQIRLFEGSSKNIEDVTVDDLLVDSKGNKVLVQKLKRYSYEGRIYGINGGQPFFTPNHPFLTLTGWKSLDPQASMKESPGLEVSYLKVGDILVKAQGLEPLLDLNWATTLEEVYNFTVSGNHEYVADDYVVHNLYKIE